MRKRILRVGSQRATRKGEGGGYILQTRLLHLLESGDSITSDRFYAFGVELGLLVRQVLELEANVTFLGEQNTRKVNLRQSCQ